MNLEQTQQEIIELICNYFSITKDQMFCKRRKREFVDARFMYALWLKENTKLSLKDIGMVMSEIPKDHTSVIHGIAEARNLLDKDSGFNKRYNTLTKICL
jgi:chromosomal replication initiation ATPase DnaA